MDIRRAGRQTKAFWRSQEKNRRLWQAEKPVTDAEKAYGQYLRTCERLQGHAAGWIDGVNWARREQRPDAERLRVAREALKAVKRTFSIYGIWSRPIAVVVNDALAKLGGAS